MARYIDVDVLIEQMKKESNLMFNNYFNGFVKAIKMVNDSPTADVQPVVYGEWVCENVYHLPKCSVCGKKSHSGEWHGENSYCGHCGAKMEVQNV